MPTKRSPKKKAAKRPATKRVADVGGGSIAEARTASPANPLDDNALDEEFDYYLAHLPEWYEHEGEHVLIHGSEHFGFFSTHNAALAEGFRRFGHVPLLVKQIQRDEKPIALGGSMLGISTVTRGRQPAMPTKRSPKKKTAKRPATKRVVNERIKSVAEAMAASLAGLLDDTLKEEAHYYVTHLPEWHEHEGKHVLIHGSDLIGFFATESAAMQEGFRRFGRVPFLVKQVQQNEKPRSLGWVIF